MWALRTLPGYNKTVRFTVYGKNFVIIMSKPILLKYSRSHSLVNFVLIDLLRVWDLDGNESTSLRLRSPGISVCWHPEEAFKVGAVFSSRSQV